MSITEIAASLLGLANVALIIRRSLWNYPFGLLMVMLYFIVFWRARLYSDAGLQVFFFVVQVYGWWNWYRARQDDGRIGIEWLTTRGRLACGALVIGSTAAEWWYLAGLTNDVAPFLDALTTALSVAAQLLLSFRKMENWLLWIVADLIQIGLYLQKDLYPTAALYAAFLVLCIFGAMEWLPRARPRGALK
jgi:nicotinamide mononucleotide transporter